MIDTHCHLTFPDFHSREQAVLDQAAEAGVTGCITISTTTLDCLDALALAVRFNNVWCSSGIHPLYADTHDAHATNRSGEKHIWQNLRAVASHPKCVAWGELGLDNHYPKPSREIQHAVLHEQLAFIQAVNHNRDDAAAAKWGGSINKPHGLPIILHCREAFDDLIPILRATTLDPSRFVFHCFTGTPADMTKILDFGASVSFTGVLTYPNAPEVRAAAALVPLDRLMVETDAPFLPPIPHRGQRPCVPAWTIHTARELARVKNIPFEALHEQLNHNTQQFFGIKS